MLITAAVVIGKLFLGYSFIRTSEIENTEKDDDEIIRSPIHENETYSGQNDVEYFLDEDGTYIPDYEDLDENEYDPALFYTENNRIYYDSENAQYGIDVSSHQEDIDWEAVAADGIDYAILRAAYRGYGSKGTLGEDEYFRQNAEAALNAGLDIGAYVFSQAITVEEAIEEADFILSIVKDYDMEYPIVYDWEPIIDDTARTDNVTNEELTQFALAFCQRIEEAGYHAAVYLNTSQGYMEYNLEPISEYDIWLADYDDTSDFYYHFNMWQYTNEGAVNGVTGPVDMNISFKNYAT